MASAAHGFIDGVELLEKKGKYVLIIGDRRIETQGAPADLLAKENEDIGLVQDFAIAQGRAKLSVDWVLESSPISLKGAMDAALLADLIYAVPVAIQKIEMSVAFNIHAFYSDYRRDEMKDFFIGADSMIQALADVSLKPIGESFATKVEAAKKVKMLWRNDKKFAEQLEKTLDTGAERVAQAQRTIFGRETTFAVFEDKFAAAKRELIAASMDPKPLEKCEEELQKLKREVGAGGSTNFTTAIFTQCKKEKSLNRLLAIFDTPIAKCVFVTVADSGFLIDVKKSQKTRDLTVFFGAAIYAEHLALALGDLGYSWVFQEMPRVEANGIGLKRSAVSDAFSKVMAIATQ